MFSLAILSCFSIFLIISIYLLIYSPYRIRNAHGFVLLLFVFTIDLIFISILPFCQFYLLYFLLFIDINSFDCLFHSIIIFYCLFESFFFLFTIEESRLLNFRSLPKKRSLPNNYDEQFIDRICNVYEKSQEDFRVCFAGWFKGIKNSSWNLIYEENILEYITMATYNVKYWNEMTRKQQKHVRHLFYEGFLKKYPQQRKQIKSGYNNQIQLRHPYRDSIRYTHYPILKYFLFACARYMTIMILKSMGFQYQMIGDITFYIRIYTKKTISSPILFLHGLSLGSSSYLLFIRRLATLDRTIILLNVPFASMRLQTEVASMSSILSSIEQLLISLHEKYVTTISHSYGSMIQSCIIKQLPHIVCDQAVLFVDPACFLIFDARYFQNFIYRKPRTPNQLLLNTFCTQDLYSIYPIERHLCWHECNLWAEDIKQSQIRIHVFLSENDDIIPVSFIEEYLKKSNIDTTVFPGAKHAQILISSKIHNDILKVLHQLETKPAMANNESVSF